MLIVSKVMDLTDNNANADIAFEVLKRGMGGAVYDSDNNIIGKYNKVWLEGTIIMCESEITEEWAIDIMIERGLDRGKLSRAKLLNSARTDEEADKMLEEITKEVEEKYGKPGRLPKR